jgi:hypothetical protein
MASGEDCAGRAGPDVRHCQGWRHQFEAAGIVGDEKGFEVDLAQAGHLGRETRCTRGVGDVAGHGAATVLNRFFVGSGDPLSRSTVRSEDGEPACA